MRWQDFGPNPANQRPLGYAPPSFENGNDHVAGDLWSASVGEKIDGVLNVLDRPWRKQLRPGHEAGAALRANRASTRAKTSSPVT